MPEALSNTVHRYLQQCRPVLAASTLKNKRKALAKLTGYLQRHYPKLHDWSRVQRTPHIEGWLCDLAQQPLKTTTRRQILLRVMLFFNELQAWQWPQAPASNPLRPDDLPPCEQTLPKPLPHDLDQALQQILAAAPGLPALGLRLLRHTGLRIGEMLALDLTAFDPSAPHGPTLRVALGKTRCQRLLPLSPDTVAILQAILQQRAQAHAPCPLPPALADALMRDACGRKLSAHACRALLKTLAVQLHTTESLYPHRLRHTFATELARAGLSVPVLMKLLGHRSPTMTLRYVDVAATDIRQHYQRALQQLKTFQHLPDCPSHPAAPDSLPAILHLLLGALEARRRDATDPRLNLALQRLAKRVRKVRDDFHNLLEKPPPPV